MKKSKYEKMSVEEKIDYNYKYINNACNVIIIFSIFNILMLIIEDGENLLSFVKNVLSYLHYQVMF